MGAATLSGRIAEPLNMGKESSSCGGVSHTDAANESPHVRRVAGLDQGAMACNIGQVSTNTRGGAAIVTAGSPGGDGLLCQNAAVGSPRAATYRRMNFCLPMLPLVGDAVRGEKTRLTDVNRRSDWAGILQLGISVCHCRILGYFGG